MIQEEYQKIDDKDNSQRNIAADVNEIKIEYDSQQDVEVNNAEIAIEYNSESEDFKSEDSKSENIKVIARKIVDFLVKDEYISITIFSKKTKLIKTKNSLLIFSYCKNENLTSSIVNIIIKEFPDIIILYIQNRHTQNRHTQNISKYFEQIIVEVNQININEITKHTILYAKNITVNSITVKRKQKIECTHNLSKKYEIIPNNNLLTQNIIDGILNSKTPKIISSPESFRKKISIYPYINSYKRIYIIKAPQNTYSIQKIISQLIKETEKYICQIIVFIGGSTRSESLITSLAIKGFTKINATDNNININQLDNRQIIEYRKSVKILNENDELIFDSNKRALVSHSKILQPSTLIPYGKNNIIITPAITNEIKEEIIDAKIEEN